MLICEVTDVNGVVSELFPVSLRLNIDELAPASSLYAVFAYKDLSELCKIRVLDDSKILFVGIIDEEEHSVSSRGNFLKLSARSLAALLLDNEASPCTYNHPSAFLMHERYASAFGLSLGESEDAVYFGELNVLKGASCYSVLKSFSFACYSAVPYITCDGALYLKGMPDNGSTVFGAGGVRYTSLSRLKKRCEELSAVYVKTEYSSGYTVPVENSSAIVRGIERRRYLNAMLTESPMRCADEMLINGARKAYQLKLRCPACLVGIEGNSATVEGEDGLYVSALCYQLSSRGEYTDVTLKRRNADVD